ncbi:hypothetical protein GC194_04585 [bacterium]|nr:hypothetical protein [bacterium]
MTRITNDGVDVSSEHNPQNDRWIELNADHTFVSDGTPFGRNTGRWSITKEGWLWLDSDAGEADDSYWTYNISGNEMRWQGQKFEFSKHFVIEHIRTDNPSE